MKLLVRLVLGMSVLAGLAAPGASAMSGAKPGGAGGRISLQCYTFREISFFETVDKARELGIKYLEMYPGQLLKPGSQAHTGSDMGAADVAEMQAKLKEAGLKVVSYGVSGIPTEESAARKHFEWARKMGLEVLVTETVPNAMLDKLAGEFGIRIALHNHPQSWPPDEVLKACSGLSARVGSCSDTGHWKRRGLVPLDQLKKLEGRIVELHFKDVAKVPGGRGYEDRPWGTGECDARAMVAELKRQGFKGYVTIEYESGSVADLMKNLPLCIEFFNKAVASPAK